MQKTTKTLWLICIAIMFAITNSKAQTTCSTSVSYTYPVSGTVTSYTNDVYWFKFTTPSFGDYQIDIAVDTTSGKIHNYHAYTGSCGSQTLCATDTLLGSAKTNFVIPFTNTTSTTYYISLEKTGVVSFTVTTVRKLCIAGDITYTQGQNDTLFALPIGASGTQTYTWMPGSLHTAQIVSTATATTTYTLTYNDSYGTLSDTISARPLPPPPPIFACDLVLNGTLDNYNHLSNAYSNIAPPSPYNTINGATQDPRNWYAPTLGTPDYYNVAEGSSSPVWVPTNLGSTNTPSENNPGSGGYAGIATYGGWTTGTGGSGGYREYIQQQLNCSLIVGQLYNVSFYTTSAPGIGGCTTNNIGAYLSTGNSFNFYTGNAGFAGLGLVPQINATAIITTSGTTWTQVSGTMIGNGEKYITIGNFYGDGNTQHGPGDINSLYPYNGYYFIDNVSVTAATPTITATSCHSGSVTLTAFGCASAVSWGDGTNTYTGNPITVPSPAVATTFTCSVNLSSACSICPTVTASIVIPPAATCSGTQPTSYTPGSVIFNPSVGYFASNMTIASGVSYTINCADTRMAAGVNITVNANGTLVIKGSWLHACNECSTGSMWQGITVQPGGKLQIINGSRTIGILHITTNNIIEDAVQAVKMASGTTAPSYTITNTIFNQNTEDIYIDANTADLSANKIYGCTFTCRNLNSHDVSIFNVGTINNDILLATPLYPSTINPIDITIAGARTINGIHINKVSSYPINVGGNSSTYPQNIFDNLDKGIYAFESSLAAVNNSFQNLTGNTTNITGIGIYSDQTSAKPIKNTLIVGNNSTTIVSGESNYFINCLIGVYAGYMHKQVYINNNIFNNETTATTFNATGTYVTGNWAVLNKGYANGATAIDPENLQFANNNVQNYAYGYGLNLMKLFNTASASTLFQSNTITGAGFSNSYSNYGIYLFQTSATAANTGVPIDAISITTNTITNMAINAIYLNTVNTSGATSGFVQIYNNGSLSVQYNAAATTLQSPPIAAISLVNAYRTRITYNRYLTITALPLGGSNFFAPARYHAGVYVNGSTNCTINCNAVAYMGENFVYQGTCTGASNSWQNNILRWAQYGLVLRTNGSLGDQGSLSYPIDDNWNFALWYSVDQTYADNSNPGIMPTSILYTQSASGSYQPSTNGNSGGTAASYATATTLITATSGSNTLICGAAGTGDRTANNTQPINGNNGLTGEDSLMYLAIQNKLNNDATPYTVYDAETRWDLQYLVSSALPTITPATGYENAKTIALADAALSNQDYGDAVTLINSFNPANSIESNWQAVTNIIITAQTDTTGNTLSANAISALQSIAAQCPNSGGKAVNKARTILNNYFNIITSYPNDCPSDYGSGQRKQQTADINNVLSKTQNISLYPNPNNGNMTLSYNLKEDAHLEMIDITGTLVETYNLPATGNTIQVKNDNLQNGVYLYRVISNNAVIKQGKIVVMK